MNFSHPRRDIDVCISAHDWEICGGDLQSALLHVLERDTQSRWRVVCANILVECIEPYRTLVLRSDVLERLRKQQQVLNSERKKEIDFSVCPEIFQVKAELHTPLAEDTQANIMLKRSTRFLSNA